MSTSTEPDAAPGETVALEVRRAHRWTPNRIVAGAVALLGVVTLVAGLAASLAVPAAIAAVLAGAALVLGVAVTWLRGWQAFEARQGEADEPVGWDDAEEILGRMHPEAVKALTERLRTGARLR